jgi:hypothetical protein
VHAVLGAASKRRFTIAGTGPGASILGVTTLPLLEHAD